MSSVVRQRLAPTWAPLPDAVPAVLAETVDHGASGFDDGLMHFLVGGAHHLVLFGGVVGGLLAHVVAEAAEVVLEVVDAPGGVGVGVLLLVAERAFESGAGFGARGGVDAELEAFGVDVVGEGFHVGEFCCCCG